MTYVRAFRHIPYHTIPYDMITYCTLHIVWYHIVWYLVHIVSYDTYHIVPWKVKPGEFNSCNPDDKYM